MSDSSHRIYVHLSVSRLLGMHHQSVAKFNLLKSVWLFENVHHESDFMAGKKQSEINIYGINHRRTSRCLQSPNNLVHIQTLFISELSFIFFFILFSAAEHYQTGFYFILDWTVTKRWSDLSICVVCSWLQSWLALLTTMFHFVARLSPLRGDCHPALCQAWSWHTNTHNHTHTHTQY